MLTLEYLFLLLRGLWYFLISHCILQCFKHTARLSLSHLIVFSITASHIVHHELLYHGDGALVQTVLALIVTPILSLSRCVVWDSRSLE